jgi:hypothetical protein
MLDSGLDVFIRVELSLSGEVVALLTGLIHISTK